MIKKIVAFSVLVFFIVPVSVFADSTITTTASMTPYVTFVYDNSQVNSAQSFTTTQAGTIAGVTFTVKANGSPSGTLTAAIHEDNAGEPAVAALASGTMAVSGITGSCADYTVTFSAPADVLNATSYWIVLSSSQAVSLTNNLNQCGATSNVYAGGVSAYSDNSWNWTNDTTSDARLVIDITDSGPSPAVDLGGATSTIEQAQGNLSTAFYLYFIAFFGTVWLLRRRV